MAFEQGHALVIGVGLYAKAPRANVPVAASDAAAVAAALKDPHTCGYPAGQVRLLVNEAATRTGTLAALDDLAARTGEGSTVFLFYCGHGAMGNDGNYYFVSHDAEVRDGSVAAGTGVSEAELIDKLRAIQARRVLVALNTCYSGQVSPSLSLEGEVLEANGAPQTTTAAILATGSGRIIITAAGEDQRSWIGRGERSYFTQALIDGLNGRGVANKAGFVSAFNLYEYIFETVTETVEERLGEKQEPELTVLKGVGPFAVSLYRGATNLGDFGEDEPAPDLPGVRQVKPEKAERLMNQIRINSPDIANSKGVITGSVGRDVNQTFIDSSGGNVDNRRIDTGGGAYVGGGLNIQGGDFVGRDKISVGDISGSSGIAIGRGAQSHVTNNVSGDQVSGGKNSTGPIQAGTVNIYQGSPAEPPDPAEKEKKPLREEAIRLDVAAPTTAFLNEPFDLAVSIRQPDAPKLSFDDLEQVKSEPGRVFYREGEEVVFYRIAVEAPGCEIQPPSYKVKLRPGENALPCWFQITPFRVGKQTIIINAFQEDETFAASTRIKVETKVPVSP